MASRKKAVIIRADDVTETTVNLPFHMLSPNKIATLQGKAFIIDRVSKPILAKPIVVEGRFSWAHRTVAKRSGFREKCTDDNYISGSIVANAMGP